MARVIGDWAYHVNPDGTKGGQVYKGSEVDPSAYVAPTAVVLPGAVVEAGRAIRGGSIITESGAEIRFDSPKP